MDINRKKIRNKIYNYLSQGFRILFGIILFVLIASIVYLAANNPQKNINTSNKSYSLNELLVESTIRPNKLLIRQPSEDSTPRVSTLPVLLRTPAAFSRQDKHVLPWKHSIINHQVFNSKQQIHFIQQFVAVKTTMNEEILEELDGYKIIKTKPNESPVQSYDSSRLPLALFNGSTTPKILNGQIQIKLRASVSVEDFQPILEKALGTNFEVIYKNPQLETIIIQAKSGTNLLSLKNKVSKLRSEIEDIQFDINYPQKHIQ